MLAQEDLVFHMIGKALYNLKGEDPFLLLVVLQQFVTLKIFKQFNFASKCENPQG